MKRYYCKRCGSVFEPGVILNWNTSCVDWVCPMCADNGTAIKIPGYETPAQYEKRTGEVFPNNRLVWYRVRYGTRKWESWEAETYSYAKDAILFEMERQIVIADPSVPPPDNWRPE